MIICQVVGNVIATRKSEELVGYKLLIVKPVRKDDKKQTDYMIAVDKIGAGVGEYVIVALGSAAYKGLREENAPIDAAVVGILDNTDFKDVI
ncbi:ethanolamine utilization protein EutN [Caldanaerobius fijiensis DSM 17918]|uniref:Ethanolamine utilization protein EutN n=1 Tax=Caldanaerobius fijiensis DSM 17918 TaxID=1121256 RepID=A0A1M5FJU6_9THEO|nr:EutN/CcmL family microcompartment protein [Caldanaerobius fijiensis]SHF91755.1 ethanolamine utilization protein EutN [Caldanaerobius fijiensis DSM 17918]